MLTSFSVGTDISKRYPGSPRIESIRPIRACKYTSPSTSMLKIVQQIGPIPKVIERR